MTPLKSLEATRRASETWVSGAGSPVTGRRARRPGPRWRLPCHGPSPPLAPACPLPAGEGGRGHARLFFSAPPQTDQVLTRSAVPKRAVYGEWVPAEKELVIPDPLTGEPFVGVPDTQLYEIEPYVASLKWVLPAGWGSGCFRLAGGCRVLLPGAGGCRWRPAWRSGCWAGFSGVSRVKWVPPWPRGLRAAFKGVLPGRGHTACWSLPGRGTLPARGTLPGQVTLPGPAGLCPSPGCTTP